MQDVVEQEARESHNTLGAAFANLNDSPGRNATNANGFVVQGGPWEQRQNTVPNTASVTDFPSFGGRNAEQPQQSPVAGVWGSRR